MTLHFLLIFSFKETLFKLFCAYRSEKDTPSFPEIFCLQCLGETSAAGRGRWRKRERKGGREGKRKEGRKGGRKREREI